MSAPTHSFRKVNYELRPAKQVERRIFLDALQLLSMDAFPIRDYQYTGMGSVYFVDYVLFHKILGIRRMLSVEFDSAVERRVHFNRPFRLVEVRMGRIGDFIPELSQDLQHILWLDYDSVLDPDQLADIRLAGTYLTCGSIFLVTVDSEPPKRVNEGGTPLHWMAHFESIAGDYLEHGLTVDDFALSQLPRLNARIINNALAAGLRGRSARFFPLFYFLYADGHHPMLTVGGMIGNDSDGRRLLASGLREAPYFRDELAGDPYEIEVPRVTRKERLALDSAMPCDDTWGPAEFELDSKELAAYREIYRFFPAYAELLL